MIKCIIKAIILSIKSCHPFISPIQQTILTDFSPVQVRHDSFADVTAGLLQDANHLGRGGGIAARVDDDGTAELGLSVGGGPQHLPLTLRDRPAGANLSDHATADVRVVGAVKHLADDDVGELRSGM